MPAPYWLSPDDQTFPDVELALREPDGLLAVGGDLSVERLLTAYRQGIFPWYSEDQPILWWSPDPRSVLFPERLKISRSLRKTLRKGRFRITLDQAFDDVIEACAAPRSGQEGTWIVDEMKHAYRRLHAAGHAHSVEAWLDDRLAGGLYGVAIGQVFFGESMFTHVSDASKVAFVHLVRYLRQWHYSLIDCQVRTAHLDSLGATQISRQHFTRLLAEACGRPGYTGDWSLVRIGPWSDDEQQPES